MDGSTQRMKKLKSNQIQMMERYWSRRISILYSNPNGSALTIQMMKKIKIHEEFVEKDLVFYIAIVYLV